MRAPVSGGVMQDDGQTRFSLPRLKASQASRLVPSCKSLHACTIMPTASRSRRCPIAFCAPRRCLASLFFSLLSPPPSLLLSTVPDDDWNTSTAFEFPWEDVMTQVRREAACRLSTEAPLRYCVETIVSRLVPRCASLSAVELPPPRQVKQARNRSC